MEEMTAREAFGAIMERSGKSRIELSHDMGKSDTYLSAMYLRGSVPGLASFVEVARVCGYKLVLERDEERIELVSEEP